MRVSNKIEILNFNGGAQYNRIGLPTIRKVQKSDKVWYNLVYERELGEVEAQEVLAEARNLPRGCGGYVVKVTINGTVRFEEYITMDVAGNFIDEFGDVVRKVS